MSRFFAIIIIVATVAFMGCSERPVKWTTFIDTGVDEAACALALQGDELFVVGTQSNPTTGRSVWLVQVLGKNGQLANRQSFAEGLVNVAQDAALADNGDLYICGRSNPHDTTLCLIVKTRPRVSAIWKRGLVLGERCWGNGICVRPDGNVAVCGAVVNGERSDMFVALLDPEGKTIWTRAYDLGPAEDAVKIAAGPDNGLAVLGEVGAGCPDIVVLRLGPNGDTLWTRRYDSGGVDEPGDIAFGVQGYILATGTARVGDSVRCVVLSYDSTGGVANRLAYGAEAQAEGHGIFVTPEGDNFVTGRLLRPGRSAVLAFQFLPDAVSVWERHSQIGTEGTGVDLVVRGDVFVAATVRRKNSDIAVVRFSRPTKPRT
ncbi:MAG: hypothetical protein ABIK44_00625 [candidate division WOR-3 bacterium]